jgi:Na+/proline symporter/signal transduction histidine kinase
MQGLEILYNPDIWWVIGLLVATIALGYYAGKDTRSVRDFAVGKRGFITPILVFTMIATEFGGGAIVGSTAEIFKSGLIFAIAGLGVALSSFLLGKYIVPRFDHRFKRMISVGDVMEGLYKDVTITKFTGIFGALFAVGMIGGQLLALGVTMQMFLGVNAAFSIILMGGIITLYSVFGGVKAVAITDVMQLAVMVIIIPIIASLGIWELKGPWGIVNRVTEIDMRYVSIVGHDMFWPYFALFLIFASEVMLFYPPLVQRLLMAHTRKELAIVFYANASFRVIFLVLITFIAFTAICLNADGGDIQANNVVLKVVENYLPAGYKGMAAIAILAAIMSTADSHLNAASVLFTHNVLMPDEEKYRQDEEKLEEADLEEFRKRDEKKLFKMRFVTAGIGILAIILAINSENILKVLYSSNALWTAIIGFPLLMGIFRFKVSPKQFWACAFTAGIAYILSVLYENNHQDMNLDFVPPLAAIIFGSIGFMTTHLLENTGFTLISEETQLRKDREGNLIETIVLVQDKVSIWRKITGLSEFVPTPTRIAKYCTDKYKKVNPQVMLFCAFCIGSYAAPFFMFPWGKDGGENFITAIVIRIIASVLCFALAFHQYWPQRYEKIMPILWHFTLFFCLPYGTTILYFVERGSQEWVLNLSLATILLISMTDWRTFVLLTILGVSSGYMTFKWFLEDPSLGNFSFNATLASLYALTFTLLIGFFFVRRKEEDMDAKEENFGSSIAMLAHEVKNYLAGVLMPAELAKFIMLNNKRKVVKAGAVEYKIEMNKEDNDTVDRMIEEIPEVASKSLAKLDQMIDAVRGVSESGSCRLYSVKSSLKDILAGLPDLRPEQRERITIKCRNDINYRGLKNDFHIVIENLIRNAFRYGGSNVNVQIFVQGQKITVEDNGVGIPEEDLYKVFEKFYTGSKASGTGLGLALCKTKIEAMGGKIYCQSELGRYTRFIIEMPKVKGNQEES